MEIFTLLDGVTGTGAGTAQQFANAGYVPFQCSAAATGALTATVVVQGSLDNSTWVNIITFSLDDTTTDADGAVQNPYMWAYVRGNVTAISGTGTAVTLKMGA